MATRPVQARQDVATLVESAERQLDVVFKRASVAAAEIMRTHTRPGAPITPADRQTILLSLDHVLAGLYGRRRGDPSPVKAIVTAHSTAAFVTPPTREAAAITTTLVKRGETALLAAMIRGDDDGKM